MKLGILIGSNHATRTTHRPALWMADQMHQSGHDVDLLDIKTLELPVYSGTDEEKQLPGYLRWLEFAKQNDGFIFFFPEYNHNVCPAVTNALTFLENREFLHKPIGLVSVSSGVGGARSTFVARGSFPTQGAIIVPTVVNILNIAQSFPDEQTCNDEKSRKFLGTLAREVEVYAESLKGAAERLNSEASIFVNI